jgi:hypothetical protein
LILTELRSHVADGKFFSVKFRKRTDGTMRVMNCRVRPPVTDGPGLPYDPAQHDLLVVWDLHKRAWRQIPADNVIELRAHGRRIA